MIKRHTKPNPQRNIKGGIVEREASLHASQRAAGLPRVRRADAHRPQDPRRRPQGPHLPQVRGSGRQMNRLKRTLPEGRRAGAHEGVRLHERDGRAQDREGRRQHGLGEATPNAKIVDAGADELGAHHRPEAGRSRRAKKSIAAVQGAQGHADRRDGHAARRADVRVPRPPDDHRAAARARLPGVSPKGFDGRGNYTLGLRTSCCSPRSTT